MKYRSVGCLHRVCTHAFARASVAAMVLGCGGDGDDRDPFAGAATAEMGGDDEGGASACAGSGMPDDVAIDPEARVPTSSAPTRVAAAASRFVVCGDGFSAVFDPAAGELSSETPLPGRCTGIAAIDDARVAVAAGAAIHVLAIEGGAPQSVASASLPASALGVASDGTNVLVAMGPAGVAVLDGTGNALTEGATIASSDARDVAWTHEGVLVAEGDDGVRLYTLAGSLVAELATDTDALGVRALGSRAVILRGGFGWDLVEIGSGSLAKLASRETEGMVLDAAIVQGEVFTADAHALVRYDASAEIVSVEPRPRAGALDGEWLRGLAVSGEHGVALDDGGLLPMTIAEPEPRPRVRLDVPALAMWTEPGEASDALLVVQNAGSGPMLLRGIETEAPLTATFDTASLDASAECPGGYVVPAGTSVPVELTLLPEDDAPLTTVVSVLTDDPDAQVVEVPVDANRPAPQVGAPAEDFSLPTLDGGTFRLSDHRGKVVFLKLFNFACSTCAEEFPQIEAELSPAYPEGDVVIVGINTGHRTSYAADLAAEADLSLPIALDLDTEVFRRLRLPGKVFPLHVVIDREGAIAWVSNEKGIEAARTAIDAAR